MMLVGQMKTKRSSCAWSRFSYVALSPPRASGGTLGVTTEVEMSTVRRGRQLFVEVDRGRRINAYDLRLTRRSNRGSF